MPAMRIRRVAVNAHKWIALVIGVQILLWIAGGVVMSVLPIESVRGEARVAEPAPPNVHARDLVSLVEAQDSAGLDALRSARLEQLLGAPVWQLSGASGAAATVDARSGALISPFDESLVRQIAIADQVDPGTVVTAERLDVAPGEYGGPVPVWRVAFDDAQGTVLYVDAATGAVRARRSDLWRFYDLFWRLHVMDYDDGAEFNHPLLIGASLVALVAACSGLVLLFLRMRQSLQVQLAVRRRRRL